MYIYAHRTGNKYTLYVSNSPSVPRSHMPLYCRSKKKKKNVWKRSAATFRTFSVYFYINAMWLCAAWLNVCAVRCAVSICNHFEGFLSFCHFCWLFHLVLLFLNTAMKTSRSSFFSTLILFIVASHEYILSDCMERNIVGVF